MLLVDYVLSKNLGVIMRISIKTVAALFIIGQIFVII